MRVRNLDALFNPEKSFPGWGRFGICPMLRNLLMLRGDIAQLSDVTTPSGVADALAWMFVRAIPEYGLAHWIDQPTLDALNTPVGYFPGLEGKDWGASTLVQFTMLMGLTWRHRDDVQKVFDITAPAGRIRFASWFVTHGVSEMRIHHLIAPIWRQSLFQPLGTGGLTHLAVLVWLARPDLQKAFNLKSVTGTRGLKAWYDAALAKEPGWAWLRNQAPAPTVSDVARRWEERPIADFGVNLIGFGRGELGIGEDMRMAVVACEAAGIPYSLVNVSTGSNTSQNDTALAAGLAEESRAPYPVNVFCLTGFETFRVFFEFGSGLFANRYNVGWWPWELPVWPAEWNAAFELVDEVWAATTFTEAVYVTAQRPATSSTPTFRPVTLMPLPASVARVKQVSRRALGLPSDKFLFLYVFDFNSYLARKNPFAALRAFREAFPAHDNSVRLVLKTMNSDPATPVWRRFLRECAKDQRVILYDKTLERGKVLGLIKVCDAYVSLHRSEGFGRTLAEAMLFGKPVVGTNFSGNVDFLSPEVGFPVKWTRRLVRSGEYPFVTPTDAAWWAEPDVLDAARQLRAARVAADDAAFGTRTKAFALKQFSPMRIGALMKARLETIHVTKVFAAIAS